MDELMPAADFTPVMSALAAWQRTGGPVALVSGWEADHPQVRPPLALTRRLGAIALAPRRYTYSREFHVARERAAAALGAVTRFAGRPVTADQVALAQNSTQALLLSLTALRDQGVRRVVIAAPGYFAVPGICRHLGLELRLVAASDYLTGALDVPRLVAAARGAATVVIVTNPAYSLGVEYAPAELARLAAALPPHATLLLDESRLGLHWRRRAPWPELDLPRPAVILRSPSKVFFANGLKLSLIAGPADLIAALERAGETLLGSVPGNAERVALAYLDAWAEWTADAASGATDSPWLRWRARVVGVLTRNLAAGRSALAGTGFVFSPADSGPYALAARCGPLPAPDCSRLARDQGVLVMSASYFLHDEPGWTGFRVNLAAEGAHLRAGLRLLGVQNPVAAVQFDAMATLCDAMAAPGDAMAAPGDAMAALCDATAAPGDAMSAPGDAT